MVSVSMTGSLIKRTDAEANADERKKFSNVETRKMHRLSMTGLPFLSSWTRGQRKVQAKHEERTS